MFMLVLFDAQLIHISRDFLGLSDVEKHTADGGVLNIHIGDVFSPDAAIPGGYAGKNCWCCQTAVSISIHTMYMQ